MQWHKKVRAKEHDISILSICYSDHQLNKQIVESKDRVYAIKIFTVFLVNQEMHTVSSHKTVINCPI